MSRPSVVIVGGGISALAAAWELTGGAAGPTEVTPRVELIEASERLGGSLATGEFAGRTIDLGADGVLARRPEATTLVHELEWAERLEAIGASGASLWLGGALHDIPAGLALGVPTSSAMVRALGGLSWRARLAARRDERLPRRLIVGEDATIGEIVRTKLGRELAYQFVEPMIGGIQAGRIDQLSARSVFPALLTAAHEGGSLMRALAQFGPVNPGPAAPTVASTPLFTSLLSGLGSLPGELARQLQLRGVVLRTGAPVRALHQSRDGAYRWTVDTETTTTPANAVVMATPAVVVDQLLGHLDDDLAALGTVTSAATATVTFCYARADLTLPPHGTGVLVPLATPWRGDGTMMVTALTLLDRKWPHLARDQDVIVRAHVGRSDDQRWASLGDDALIERVGAELGVLLDSHAARRDARVQRWLPGLPQYLVGHEVLVAHARAAAAHIRVTLCGNTYDGVGVPACIGSGRRAAREVLALLHDSGSVTE